MRSKPLARAAIGITARSVEGRPGPRAIEAETLRNCSSSVRRDPCQKSQEGCSRIGHASSLLSSRAAPRIASQHAACSCQPLLLAIPPRPAPGLPPRRLIAFLSGLPHYKTPRATPCIPHQPTSARIRISLLYNGDPVHHPQDPEGRDRRAHLPAPQDRRQPPRQAARGARPRRMSRPARVLWCLPYRPPRPQRRLAPRP